MLSKTDQTKRHAPLKEKAVKDGEYLKWFHNQGFGCMVCGEYTIEAHHVKEHSTDKKDDHCIVPLCVLHHRYDTELSPHGAPKAWRETYPIDVQRSIAEKIYQVYKER